MFDLLWLDLAGLQDSEFCNKLKDYLVLIIFWKLSVVIIFNGLEYS